MARRPPPWSARLAPALLAARACLVTTGPTITPDLRAMITGVEDDGSHGPPPAT